ncbi:4558_t:CDS:2 [Ambispora gerdemannii]|uniref:4558_t:CDS:1 n=1 Tax=Ambispora gerdemannii TaxID=144530 RepID=A0A9N8YVZ5_9GLOM|nr:4558_t:CDS:2 [Ambispora gerdemannii]
MSESIPKARNVTHTMTKLYSRLEKGTIDITPDFQRDVVWGESRQSHLIDSVLKNFYIPPLIFSCKQVNNKLVRVCIDGKQRLTSIKRFMDNKIPHVDAYDSHKEKRYYSQSKNGRSRTLSQLEREMFGGSGFICVEYSNLTLKQEQEIFGRVQFGMTLTSAEKLKAISSPVSEYAHQIFSTYPSLARIVDARRDRAFQLIVQSLHMIETEPPNFRSTPSLITKYIKLDRNVPRELYDTTQHVFKTLDSLIEADVTLINRSHRLAPIEFVFVCYMIAKHPDLSIEQYQHYILSMKQDVRQSHVDIRFNRNVYDTLMGFLRKMSAEIDNPRTSPTYNEVEWIKVEDNNEVEIKLENNNEVKRIKRQREDNELVFEEDSEEDSDIELVYGEKDRERVRLQVDEIFRIFGAKKIKIEE